MAIRRFFTTGHSVLTYSSTGVDSYGEPIESWTTHSVRGKLWPLSGGEQLSADKMTLFATHKFAMSQTTIAVSETSKVVSGGVTFDVKNVMDRKRPDGSGHIELALELVR